MTVLDCETRESTLDSVSAIYGVPHVQIEKFLQATDLEKHYEAVDPVHSCHRELTLMFDGTYGTYGTYGVRLARHVSCLRSCESDPIRPPIQLEQLLDHMIANALRYRQPGSDVELRLKKDDLAAVVEVFNRGSHIPDDMLEKIFSFGVTTHVWGQTRKTADNLRNDNGVSSGMTTGSVLDLAPVSIYDNALIIVGGLIYLQHPPRAAPFHNPSPACNKGMGLLQ